MRLHELNLSTKVSKKRVGRGPGSGLGKTSGRGQDGQKSRSGYSRKRGFEGGGFTLLRKTPSIGFSNAAFATRYATINLTDLNVFEEGITVTPELLKETGLLKNQLDGVKILGNGTLEKKINVRAHKFSKTAKAAIEALGGQAEVI
ncbi:MAG: 50S ribosomal protein L15 [Bacilli bacterium]